MSEWIEVGYWVKKVVSNLVLLPASPLIVAVLGAMQLRRRRRLGAFLIGLALTTLFVFSLPIVANALAAHDERLYPPLEASIPLPPQAAIVVLGGGVQQGAADYGGETINPITLARLRSATQLAARTHLPILVSGGRLPTSAHSEAEQMAASMDRDFHTPVKWMEQTSFDTADNARLSTPILKAAGIQTAVLVTDVSHMRRARAAFEATGMQVISAPTDYYANSPIDVLSFIPNTNALRRSNWTLHEWLGVLWMRMHN
jgi:uncharacterized SAM-binding protein YcdF (DUF218 family)